MEKFSINLAISLILYFYIMNLMRNISFTIWIISDFSSCKFPIFIFPIPHDFAISVPWINCSFQNTILPIWDKNISWAYISYLAVKFALIKLPIYNKSIIVKSSETRRQTRCSVYHSFISSIPTIYFSVPNSFETIFGWISLDFNYRCIIHLGNINWSFCIKMRYYILARKWFSFEFIFNILSQFLIFVWHFQ